MTYLVLARKWRPRSFDTLVGQDHVVRALTHALDTQRLHHAWLFTGTRGVGKTTLSRILAKSLNCESGITARPCGVCRACVEIDAGRFVDYVELDAASNRGVDEMTQLLEQAVYAPGAGRFKVYMIDEVHMLTGHAFNAMLKTLEEPPPHVKFILATTDPQKIPVTVLSRCLQFNLKQMPPDAIVGHLRAVLGEEQVPFELAALRLIAQAASGSMRDALSLTDQAIAYSAGNLTEDAVRGMLGTIDQRHLVRLLEALAGGDAGGVLAVADELATRGLSYGGALGDLAVLLSRVAIEQRVPGAMPPDDPISAEIGRLAQVLHPDAVQLFYSVAVHSRGELALAPDEYAGFVMACLRMLALSGDAEPPPGKGRLASGESRDREPAVAAGAAAAAGDVRSGAAAIASATVAMPAAPAMADGAATDSAAAAGTSGAVRSAARAGAPLVDHPRSAREASADRGKAAANAAPAAPGATPAGEAPWSTDPATGSPARRLIDAPKASGAASGTASESATVPAGVPADATATDGLVAALDVHTATDATATTHLETAAAAVVDAGLDHAAKAGDDAKAPAGSGVLSGSIVSDGAASTARAKPATGAKPAPGREAVAGIASASGAATAAPPKKPAVSAANANANRPAAVPPPSNAGATIAPWEDRPDEPAGSSADHPGSANPAAPAVTAQGADEPPDWVNEVIPDDAGAGFQPDDSYRDGAAFMAPADDDDNGFETLGSATAQPAVQPVAALPRTPAPRSRGKRAARVTDMTAAQWPALAAKLPVTGLAAEVARQSEWMGVQGDAIQLRVAVRTLADSASRLRLQTVLCEHFGQSVRLEVEVGATGDATAHAVAQHERAERQRAAEAAAAADPFVQALVSEFDGQIVTGSIRYVESPLSAAA